MIDTVWKLFVNYVYRSVLKVLDGVGVVVLGLMNIGLIYVFDFGGFFSLATVISIYLSCISLLLLICCLPRRFADKLSIQLSYRLKGISFILISLPVMFFSTFLLVIGIIMLGIGIGFILFCHLRGEEQQIENNSDLQVNSDDINKPVDEFKLFQQQLHLKKQQQQQQQLLQQQQTSVSINPY
eukprot:TRINITY_DN24514_c0_g1_i1.p1 TRINITY_DN24514_c0_g1~~TRINITY_DN24514_c0_g1_i1.p1  ORF type:complete len:192 (+),score=38.28 TRINITY_DN24514_c0_g1_i1:30-578(+)